MLLAPLGAAPLAKPATLDTFGVVLLLEELRNLEYFFVKLVAELGLVGELLLLEIDVVQHLLFLVELDLVLKLLLHFVEIKLIFIYLLSELAELVRILGLPLVIIEQFNLILNVRDVLVGLMNLLLDVPQQFLPVVGIQVGLL